jgi:hypothetical protein
MAYFKVNFQSFHIWTQFGGVLASSSFRFTLCGITRASIWIWGSCTTELKWFMRLGVSVQSRPGRQSRNRLIINWDETSHLSAVYYKSYWPQTESLSPRHLFVYATGCYINETSQRIRRYWWVRWCMCCRIWKRLESAAFGAKKYNFQVLVEEISTRKRVEVHLCSHLRSTRQSWSQWSSSWDTQLKWTTLSFWYIRAIWIIFTQYRSD